MITEFKEIKKRAKSELEEAEILFRKNKRKLSPEDREQFKNIIQSLAQGLKSKDAEALEKSISEYKFFREKHFSGVKINKTWETLKEILWILLIVFLIRWLAIEPFRIPSGSMIPTLLVGDQLMVNKFIYGWQIPLTTKKLTNFKKPERGEIIVFKFPKNTREDYVKRVVGVPGDRVMMRDGVLFINDKEVPRQYVSPYTGPIDAGFCSEYDLYLEKLGKIEHQMILCHRSHIGDDFGPVDIPKGYLWVMGDNRDNSSDSRSWGLVPMENIKGRAWFIHLPLDPSRHYIPRWNRFFKRIR